MLVNPHPIVLSARAEQRRADLYAWADRFQRENLTRERAINRLSWLDLGAFVAVVLALSAVRL